jgi:hypothetical protein
VETLVVLAIMLLLVGLHIPAVHASRERARWSTCVSHQRQIELAVRLFHDSQRKLPELCATGGVGGWAIELLPYLENEALADSLESVPNSSPMAINLLRERPAILSCPAAFEGNSFINGVSVAHYTIFFIRHRSEVLRSWEVGDVPTDYRGAWAASPELMPRLGPEKLAPHAGGYNIILGFPNASPRVFVAPGK